MTEPEAEQLRVAVARLVQQVGELKASELALLRVLNELCAVVPKDVAAVLARYEGYQEGISRAVLGRLGASNPGAVPEVRLPGNAPHSRRPG